MAQKISRFLLFTFLLLAFFVPLFFWPKSYELFEFNKIILVYFFTTVTSALWLAKMIVTKKIIFRRTILDIPLIIFWITQLISTIFSIDPRTSFLGYYSRFNGGLLSTTCYLLLYWAYVSNFDFKKSLKIVKTILFSGILVSLYGILEHFGIDKDIWVQDVQNRVFSTLGQPNWLAAWLIVLIPTSWAIALISKERDQKSEYIWWLIASIIFFLTFLFTKSRSGALGFVTTTAIFIFGFLSIRAKSQKTRFKIQTSLIGIIAVFILLGLTINTPWRPQIFSKLFANSTPTEQVTVTGPALETMGTESGEIRKIVWKGALEIWKHYPIIGSGVETFAYSYYGFRPPEHNLVSEWDFLYNKAHNEYLNYLATTGSLGLIGYLLIVGLFLFNTLKIFNHQRTNPNIKAQNYLVVGLLSGWFSILITNFFGFAVVPISLAFFLILAIIQVLYQDKKDEEGQTSKLNSSQIILISAVGLTALFITIKIVRYWKADLAFAAAKTISQTTGDLVSSQQYLLKAISLSPKEAIFRSELAENSADIALALIENKQEKEAEAFAQKTVTEANLSSTLSPYNLAILRQKASTFIKLSQYDPQAIYIAKQTLIRAEQLAPTDAKIIYNLGLIYYQTNETQKAIETMQKAVNLKPNYRDARIALANLYTITEQFEKAKEEYQYVLEKINPEDILAKTELQKLK